MSITLPLEMANMVKSRVASGDYVSESEVIREGLRAQQEREGAVEHWLRTEVAATYDAYKADPARAKPLADAWMELEALMDDIGREDAL
jgi:putative addiction module CopG family antidote